VAGNETVALVLAGGGARGAYEVGALSVLLPWLGEHDQRPDLFLGTSIGALNAAYFGATADHDDIGAVVARGKEHWRAINWPRIWRRPIAPRAIRQLAAYGGEVWGKQGGPWSVLDPAPMAATIKQIVPFERLRDNVTAGGVRVALVATAAVSSESVVFVAGGAVPPPDKRRGITYRPTAALSARHVQASAAIPGAFPAVALEDQADAPEYFFDGGVRLNTPIKPAIKLGADRILVIGLNSISIPQPRANEPRRPDIFDGVSQLMQATLADPLANDLRTLVHDNGMIGEALRAGVELKDRRLIRYAFISPREPDRIGRIAQEVFRTHFRRRRALLRWNDLASPGRLVGAGEDPLHGELFSYVFFDGRFTSRLIDLGREDAQRWLDTAHDDGFWRIASDPPS
jgi:NTE family protein